MKMGYCAKGPTNFHQDRSALKIILVWPLMSLTLIIFLNLAHPILKITLITTCASLESRIKKLKEIFRKFIFQ